MRRTRTILLLLGLLAGSAYVVKFYHTRMPTVEDQLLRAGPQASMEDDSTKIREPVWRRAHVFQFLLFPELLFQRWFGSPLDVGLLDRLPVLLIAGVILAYAASLGWLLMALCGADRRLTRLETLVFSPAVGLNVVSTYVLAVGLFGQLDNPLIFAVPAALTLAAAGRLRWRRTWEPSTEDQKPSGPADAGANHADWLSPRWLWLAAPFILMIFLGGMLPPVDFDVREYHLQVPKEFYQQGRIGFLPHNVYGNMPMGTEMLSLLAMVISGAIVGDWWLGALAGKTVIAAMTPLTALAVFAAGRRFFSTTAAVVATLVYVSIPWIIRVSSDGLVEGASAYYLLLAVYAVLLWNGSPPDKTSSAPSCLLLAGYLAGGAVSCKYPAVLFVIIPLGIRVGLATGRTGWGIVWKPLGVFLLAASLGCGLWFGKNWVLTGNPTYPLLYNVFGGKTRTIQKNQQWRNVHRPKDFTPAVLAKDLSRVGLKSEWLSPLVVPLAVLAFLARRPRRLEIELLAYFAYVIAAWWLLTHRIDRFWVPALPVAALLAGVGACWSFQRVWRVALLAMLLVAAGSNLLTAGFPAGGYNAWFVRLESLRDDPRRVDRWHRYLNTCAAGGKVLAVGDAAVFDLEVPVLYNTCLDDCLFEQLVKGRSGKEIRAALAAQGISHVYVDWDEIERYRKTYGFANYTQPDEFVNFVKQKTQWLAREGVLEPLQPSPELDSQLPWVYRVRAD